MQYSCGDTSGSSFNKFPDFAGIIDRN